MSKHLLINNAKHEAGHWLTGWVLGKASESITLSYPQDGSWTAHCDRKAHPEFSELFEVNEHLRCRVINLLSGARAECFNGTDFQNDMFIDLISEGNGAWPDYFVAGELFRYYYRTLNSNARGTYSEEWLLLIKECDSIVSQNYGFIEAFCKHVLVNVCSAGDAITFELPELIKLFNIHSHN
jgi:hypothetical protein